MSTAFIALSYMPPQTSIGDTVGLSKFMSSSNALASVNLSTIQKKMVETFRNSAEFLLVLPKIHAMLLDRADGLLRKLPISIPVVQAKIGLIYSMYQYPGVTPATRQSDPDTTTSGAKVLLSKKSNRRRIHNISAT